MDDVSSVVAPDPGGPVPGRPDPVGRREAPGHSDPGRLRPPGESDGGSDSHQVDQVDLADAMDALLGEVDAALARLDAGTYGRCATCGVELDEELLDRSPTAVWCEACDARARVSPDS